MGERRTKSVDTEDNEAQTRSNSELREADPSDQSTASKNSVHEIEQHCASYLPLKPYLTVFQLNYGARNDERAQSPYECSLFQFKRFATDDPAFYE